MRPDLVRFEGFEYRREQQCLIYAGQRLAIGSRALALLELLLASPGVYLRPCDLMRAAWPDTHVDESNLRVQLSALRRQLAVCGRPVIQNAPGRGYAFVGALEGRYIREPGDPASFTWFSSAGPWQGSPGAPPVTTATAANDVEPGRGRVQAVRHGGSGIEC